MWDFFVFVFVLFFFKFFPGKTWRLAELRSTRHINILLDNEDILSCRQLGISTFCFKMMTCWVAGNSACQHLVSKWRLVELQTIRLGQHFALKWWIDELQGIKKKTKQTNKQTKKLWRIDFNPNRKTILQNWKNHADLHGSWVYLCFCT